MVNARPCRDASADGQRGFTYLAVLFLVAIMGAGLAAVATVWQMMLQREKEQELLFIGHQFRRAIGLYYERTPGAAKQFPADLGQLLRDDRYVTNQRYLRRIYDDPMTGRAEWGLVKTPDGRIMGVYSLSEAAALKTGNFAMADAEFAGKTSYSEWKFIHRPVSAFDKMLNSAPSP